MQYQKENEGIQQFPGHKTKKKLGFIFDDHHSFFAHFVQVVSIPEEHVSFPICYGCCESAIWFL